MKVLTVLLLAFAVSTVFADTKRVVCYYGTWTTYRHSSGQCNVEHLNPFLCTHLMYAFFGIQESGEIRIIDPYLDLEENWGRGNIKKFNALKQINPGLKTLAAVGGWNEGSIKFSTVAKDPAKRRIFINSAREFIQLHGFDGLDLDWEYPAQRGGDIDVDRENYVLFLKELKEEFSRYNLLLTAAVASAEFSASQSYIIPEVSKYLDFINVMAYDLRGAWDKTIGIHSGLYASEVDVTPQDKQLNVDAAIKFWLSKGAPAEKIVLGLPFYGRTFTLADPNKNKIGDYNSGPGLGGQYSNEPGFIGYNELCEKFRQEPWNHVWEEQQKVPYAFRGNQWVGYEDKKSIQLKAEYAKELKLGGIMIWSIESDDFRGICGENYSLLRTINAVIRDDTEIPNPEPTEGPIPTEVPPGNGFECVEDGYFADPENCSFYFICHGSTKFRYACPPGLKFDERINSCNYGHLVDC